MSPGRMRPVVAGCLISLVHGAGFRAEVVQAELAVCLFMLDRYADHAVRHHGLLEQ